MRALDSIISTSFVRLFPNTRSGMMASDKVGVLEWGDLEIPVYCCSNPAWNALEQHLGKPPISEKWNAISDADGEDLAICCWYAFGAEKSPIPLDELKKEPTRSFHMAMREVVTVFFWGGPLTTSERSASTQAPSNGTSSESEKTGQSGTQESGTQVEVPST